MNGKRSKKFRKAYERRNNFSKIVHWKLCGKYNLERDDEWYVHTPESVIEIEKVKILQNVMIRCDRKIEAMKSDVVVKNKGRSVKELVFLCQGTIKLVERRKLKFRNIRI